MGKIGRTRIKRHASAAGDEPDEESMSVDVGILPPVQPLAVPERPHLEVKVTKDLKRQLRHEKFLQSKHLPFHFEVATNIFY